MKSILIIIILTLIFLSCNETLPQESPLHEAGYNLSCDVFDIVFNLKYCPGGTFPSTNMFGNIESIDDFWIADTEVTYELWEIVYNWAQTQGYTFKNQGTMGDDNGDTNKHPVTTISWRDAIIWCNALTEYFIEIENEKLTFAYTNKAGNPFKDSVGNETDLALCYTEANGFRLPNQKEWECAAKWQGEQPTFDAAIELNGLYWTPKNYASGALNDCEDEIATQAACWYLDNSQGSTHEVGLKPNNGNQLGLYDMSGNVWEYSFEPLGPNSICIFGGSWETSASYVSVELTLTISKDSYTSNHGFRIIKNP